ncbi:hypothetical protein NPIL_179191 [Nephila pilipes]|uniref:Uncharacterized protein n=1 Tax=Nephila pilipes TaxID=299642 RepID=A0A8X6TG67_NEPPI|nr:hypothetical protein NPIL_179191 [Nephila pilipes]
MQEFTMPGYLYEFPDETLFNVLLRPLGPGEINYVILQKNFHEISQELRVYLYQLKWVVWRKINSKVLLLDQSQIRKVTATQNLNPERQPFHHNQ